MVFDMSGSLYKDNIMDHYKNPRNKGKIENSDVEFKENNPVCGDEISVTIKLDGDVIKDIKYEARGCAISIASMSMLSDFLKGKKTSDVMKMDKKDIMDLLNIPIGPARLKCALLGLETVKKGIQKKV